MSAKATWSIFYLLLTGLLLLPPDSWAQAQPEASRGTSASAAQTNARLKEVGFDQKPGDSVSRDLVFKDEQGNDVKLGDYMGDKPVVLALVYYECPMLCNMVLNGLVSSLKVLKFDPGKDFQVVVVSFDPKETPALAAQKRTNELKQYDRPGTESGWHFLTGKPASIDPLTKSVGFRYVYDEKQDQYAHASGIIVLTPDGQISRYLFGIEYPPKDLRLALVEASQNTIGNVVDQALLLCFHYDPSTGKYGAAVMNIIRLGGVLTILAIVGLWLLLRRRGKHSPPVAARGMSS